MAEKGKQRVCGFKVTARYQTEAGYYRSAKNINAWFEYYLDSLDHRRLIIRSKDKYGQDYKYIIPASCIKIMIEVYFRMGGFPCYEATKKLWINPEYKEYFHGNHRGLNANTTRNT